jgi:tetratricopeptide (TPR) repeat protein
LRKLLAEADQSTVDAGLLSLARKDLLAARPGREDAYRFRHVLIRDAAYAGIPKELRARLHERFADWAAHTSAGRAGDLDEIVGYHLEQAFRYRAQLGIVDDEGRELGDRAAALLGAAGQRAFARDDAPAAVNLLDRALALATDASPARLELMRQLSSALWSVGEVARAESLLNGLLEAASAAGDRRYELYGSLQQSAWRGAHEPDGGSREAAAELAHEAIRVFEEHGDDVGLAQAWRHLGSALSAQSRYAASVEACERALEHARRAKAGREESRAADLLCMGLLHGPTPVAAAIGRAEKLLEGTGKNQLLEANVVTAVAELKAMQTSFDDARELLLTARQTYETLGLRLALAGLMQVGGTIELMADDPAAAERILREGYELLLGISGWQGAHGLRLAEALQRQERYAEASALVDAVEAQTRSGELEDQVHWATVKGPLLAHDGDSSGAEEIVRGALEAIERTDALNLHALVLTALAEVQQLSGDRTAPETARTAVSLFRRKGNIAAAERAASLFVTPARR